MERKPRKGEETLAQRVQIILDDMGWTKAELARAAKVTRQTVQTWWDGTSGKINDPHVALNIQAKSGYTVKWIQTGLGDRKEPHWTEDTREFADAFQEAPEALRSVIRLILRGQGT